MDTIGKRLDKAAEIGGFKSRRQMCESIGMSYNTLNTWIKNNKITKAAALQIAKHIPISEEYLMTGVGDPEINRRDNISENTIQIPYYKETYASAGGGAYNDEEAPKYINLTKRTLEELLGLSSFNGLHLINAVGDSMTPTIESGDKLFILPFEADDRKIREGGIYVISCPFGVFVKRLYPNPFKKEIVLKSDNKDVAEIVVHGDEMDGCEIVGRVVGSAKQF